ncbi:MAG: low specificity L-threonine aldolase [Parvularculaceae bacterium]|nr:low specificity L-threonine aldolase [Parvularculaceae bacterium]
MLFTSDNWGGVHPKIMEAILASGVGFAPAYGNDETTKTARDLFEEVFEHEMAVAFVPTGSAANGIGLSLLTPPFGAIVCHEHAHVLIDECGAPEFYTGGAKVLPAAGAFGKMTPDTVRAAMAPYDPPMAHRVKPSVVSLTQATEWGTVYSPDEIGALSNTARSYGMAMHMDGARFAGAVNATGASPADLTWRSGVDILSLGGTKNGCLCAEAVVVFDRSREEELTYRCKRAGLGTSKQRYFSAQWQAYFAEDLWLSLARQSHDQCQRLASAMRASSTIEALVNPAINELFVRMSHETAGTLREAGAQFYDWIQPGDVFAGEARRFLTSWETTDEQLSELAAVLRR